MKTTTEKKTEIMAADESNNIPPNRTYQLANAGREDLLLLEI